MDAIISGIGQSAVGRGLGRSGLDLTLDAALEAIADAGLTPADIDGLATYPGAFPMPPGFAGWDPLARAQWVAAEEWDALSDAEYRALLPKAYEIIKAKLPRSVQNTLAASAASRAAAVRKRPKR